MARTARALFEDAPGSRTWFEQWCAYPLQRLGTKLYTAAVLWGTEQGAGKSLVGETLGSLYGENYHELSLNELYSDFNDWVAFRQYVLVNEIVSTGRKKDADHLKGLITRQYATVNRKYQPKYVVRDYINYLITSNHPDALFLEDTDRRFFVHRVERKLDRELANRVVALGRTTEGRASLLHHLLNVNVDDFDPRTPAPSTDAKSEMIDASRSDIERFVHDKIEDAISGVRSENVTAGQLCDEFKDQHGRKPSIKEITVVLQRLGARNLGQKRVANTSRRERLWSLPTTRLRHEAEPELDLRTNGLVKPPET